MPVTRERSCTDKRRFLTRREAARVARTVRKNGRTQGNPREDRRNPDLHMRPYECRFCGCWHIGHFTPTADYPDRGEQDVPWWQAEGCPDCGGRQFTRTTELVTCDACDLPVDEA